MTRPVRPAFANRRFLWIVGALAATAIAVVALLRDRPDGMERYPHAFLAAPGYDPSAIVVIHAPIEWPPTAPERCLPAWRCTDPSFADQQGHPWLFPMRTDEEVAPTPPLHPRLGRRPDISHCTPFRTPEADAMLEAYRARRSR